jgi:tetratricopeptide (TPR) repeat protein
MTRKTLDSLRSRSDELGGDGSAEALEVDREVLRRVPGDPVSSNRLGIALLNAGHYEEAEAVFIAALEANPDNVIASRRLDEVHRKQNAPPPAPARGTSRASGPRSGYWIKSLHYDDDNWTIKVGEETWISDVGRRTKDGTRVYRQDGVPWGEPSWRVGDEVGVYLGGTLKVPVLVRVLAPPEFNPTLVQDGAQGQEPDAGERWPWVTKVLGIGAVPVEKAPTLDDLEIPRELVQRRPRFAITAEQHARLVQALSS